MAKGVSCCLEEVPRSLLQLQWPLYLFLFQSNPFRTRICHVFSTSIVKDGSLTFEDFLDLLSAFSDSATLEIKSHYAFRIFGKHVWKKPCACDYQKHIWCYFQIFRLWWWWNAWLWWPGETYQLPDWRDWRHKTNPWGDETAHQQCEWRDAVRTETSALSGKK